ncbi:hypothetical protein [Streptomyces tubercidicus]|uniref:hypothetical protein n=1 Tax=Streptomyces tubercidicus TaxID=47759 RepID=UPI0036AF1237
MSDYLRQQAEQIFGPPPEYGWIITKGGDGIDGLTGPNGIPKEISARLRAGEGRKFRMYYSGDPEVAAYGRIITPDDEVGGELDFAPLDDWGKGGLGCGEIRYHNPETDEWVEL